MKPYKERIEGFTAQFKEQMASLYEQGYKDGIKDGNINDGTLAEKVNEAYQNGLSDAWECAREIYYMPANTLISVFGSVGGWVDHSVEEARQMIKDYKENAKKPCCVNAYDEIIYEGDKCVVTDIEADGYMCLLDEHGRAFVISPNAYYKTTGRRFPEMKKILEQLQEGGVND